MSIKKVKQPGYKKIQLEILEEFIHICEKNNLVWYAIGGTVLGAVRHQGYIPWDVDIDVGMMRNDYEKFISICSTQLSEKYTLATYKNQKYHYSPHAKIYRNNSIFILGHNGKDINKNKKDHKGIFIDIFPLDNAPEGDICQKKHSKELFKIKKLRYYKQGHIFSAGFLGTKLIGKRIISLFLLPISMRKINKKLDDVMTKYRNSNSGYIVSMASKYSYEKQLMKKEVYGIPKKIKFEDIIINIPEKYDFYLTRLYKDYMKLPSEEERIKNQEMVLYYELPSDVIEDRE